MLRPARWLGRLTSPRRHPRRQARPFTAELAPTGVSSSQSLLSLLGPTTYCRDGILTRSCIKERRLHQKQTKGTKELNRRPRRKRREVRNTNGRLSTLIGTVFNRGFHGLGR